MWIGHRKEIRKLTFRALALRRSEISVTMRFIRSDEGLTLETSAFESLYGGRFTLSTQLIKPNYLANLKIVMYEQNGNYRAVRELTAESTRKRAWTRH